MYTGSHYYILSGDKGKPVERPISELGINIRDIDAVVTSNRRTYFIKVITSSHKGIPVERYGYTPHSINNALITKF